MTATFGQSTNHLPGDPESYEPSLLLGCPLPLEDLSGQARSGSLPEPVNNAGSGQNPTAFDRALMAAARGLSRRRSRHVLVTGPKGVGKTTLVRELARRSALGIWPSLGMKHFVRTECANVPPEETRIMLAATLRFFRDCDDPNLVVCFDGLGALLRAAGGATNSALLRAAWNDPRLQTIGILTRWDFDELLSADAEIVEMSTRVDLSEPDDVTARLIAEQAAGRLAQEFQVEINPTVVERAVNLSAKFIWNQCLPAKAIGVLERACEELDFERSQSAAENPDGHSTATSDGGIPSERGRWSLSFDRVVSVVSEKSGVPAETLRGDIDDTDYEQLLGSAVVGQEEAVGAVAKELRLIRAGITDPGKPASVMLFCGLNGVGKTELAKRLAEIYSVSKRLQTYTMANFIESHSVSGIIGVPAGYVGHDQGGRLINDLNADPYGVFLLDEIEKSHPDVMKPFLNLFDEGWIVDQRGIKACADRAVFIMTSNAGYEAISQMHQDRRPMDEIVEHVKNSLARVRNERSSQPVLSQAFLARIKRIVVFNPLTEDALRGIATILVERVRQTWKQFRGKEVVIPDGLISHIARQGQRLNEKSGGREGGRGIRRLITDLIEDRIQRAAADAKKAYRDCHTIELGMTGCTAAAGTPAGDGAEPQVNVSFR